MNDPWTWITVWDLTGGAGDRMEEKGGKLGKLQQNNNKNHYKNKSY